MGKMAALHAAMLPHAAVNQIREFLAPDARLEWLFAKWTTNSALNQLDKSESTPEGRLWRRDDLLLELDEAISIDNMEHADKLFPEYLKFFQANDAPRCHARLLKTAIAHQNKRFIQTLFSCDPRGKLIRTQKLLEAVISASTNGVPYTPVIGILTGEEPSYARLVWDHVAVQQAISTNDKYLIEFMLVYVELSLNELGDSVEYAAQLGRKEFAAKISSVMTQIRWNQSLKAISPQRSVVYELGERVLVQLPMGVHFWTGTIYCAYLNDIYDVQVVDHSLHPLILFVASDALRLASNERKKELKKCVVKSLAQATVCCILSVASSNIVKSRNCGSLQLIQPTKQSPKQSSEAVNQAEKECDDEDNSIESGESESDSDCSSDCDCSDCRSECGSDCDCDKDNRSDDSSSSEYGGDDRESVSDNELPPIVSPDNSDPLYILPETDECEHIIALDADAVLKIVGCEDSHDESKKTKVDDTLVPQALEIHDELKGSDIEDDITLAESPISHNVQCEIPARESIATDAIPITNVICCPVEWTSSTCNIVNFSDLRIGDDVNVRYQGRDTYVRACIVDIDACNASFEISYPDGKRESAVPREYIKPVDTMSEAVEVNPHDLPQPLVSEAVTSDKVDSNSAVNSSNLQEFSPGIEVTDHLSDAGNPSIDEKSKLAASSTDICLAVASGSSSTVNDIEIPNDIVLGSNTPSCEAIPVAVPLQSPKTDSKNGSRNLNPGLPRYHIGQEIEANFLSIGKFHRAKIVRVHTDEEAYDVAFSEFDQTELRVLPTNIQSIRVSTRKMKSLLVGSSSSVTPLGATSNGDCSTHSSCLAVRQSGMEHVSCAVSEETSNKLSEVRNPSSSLAQVAPLSVSMSQRNARSSSSSRVPTSRTGNISTRERLRSGPRDIVTSGEVEEWRNVDTILSRKRRLLHSITGNVETTKVPWGEEFANIQSLKRFATQHPEILREHIASQLSGLGIQAKSPDRRPASPTRSTQAQMANARDTLLMTKDLAFLLRQRLSPFFDVVVPVVLPAVFSSERRFLCDTAYEVLESLVTHCSSRKLALVLLQQGVIFNDQGDVRLLNLTSLYVEKCFENLSASEIGALVVTEPSKSKSASTIAKLLAVLLTSRSIPTRIAIEKSLQHIRRELGDRRFEQFVRCNLERNKADMILYGEQLAGQAGRRSPSKSPRKQLRGVDPRGEVKSINDGLSGCQSPSILQRMLQQRHSRVRPSPPPNV